MLKKPIVFCYGGFHVLSASSGSTSTRPTVRHPPIRRTYATLQDAPGGDLTWPKHSTFTPYDLFKQERGAPYSKSRFYDLVKIYHPDRPSPDHPLCRDISPEVRLQRYRLIVTAHEILSDPVKRAAYDQFGHGWNLGRGGAAANDAATAAQAMYRYGSRDYGPIHSNATWEDWEEWRNRGRPKQRNAVDNRTFTSMIVLLTLFGIAVQASWIGQYNSGYEQRLREINEESIRLLSGRRHQTVNQLGSTDARVQHFLVRRDPFAHGLKEEEQDIYQEALDPRQPAATVEAATPRGDNNVRSSEPSNAES